MTSRIDRMSLAPHAKRSALFSITVLMVNLVGYAAMVFAAIAAGPVWLKLAFSFGAGTMIALSAIVGHDAGHPWGPWGRRGRVIGRWHPSLLSAAAGRR